MSRIRSKNTKIEIILRELLIENNLDFIMHPKMVGSPDFLVGGRIAVFVNGDFWHGYDYKRGRIPPQKFWREKIVRNMERDRKVQRKLRNMGFSVVNFWEHDVNRRPTFCITKLLKKSEDGK